MEETWPYYNELPVASQPITLHPTTTHPEGQPLSEAAQKFITDTYELRAEDCTLEVWYRGASGSMVFLPYLSETEAITIHQMPDSIPFYPTDVEDVVIADDPEDETEVQTAYSGMHSHSVVLTHPITLQILRELRAIESLSYEEPMPLLLVLTYRMGETVIARSRFLGNWVRYDSMTQHSGVLAKQTVFQCYAALLFEPPPATYKSVEHEYDELLIQASVHQQYLESEDFDDDDNEVEEEGDMNEDS